MAAFLAPPLACRRRSAAVASCCLQGYNKTGRSPKPRGWRVVAQYSALVLAVLLLGQSFILMKVVQRLVCLSADLNAILTRASTTPGVSEATKTTIATLPGLAESERTNG